MCTVTLCRESPTRFLLARDDTVLLCGTHKAMWGHSSEFARARRQVLELVDLRRARRSLTKRARAAFDAQIKKAWHRAMDDFIRRVVQEQWTHRPEGGL